MNTAKRYVVGLTGGIGSGKSAAAEIFRTCGIEVIDADSLAREVVELGQPALGDIAAHFGSGILTAQGHLDRAALRKIVFSNPEHKSWLENLLHPLIAELLQRRLNATKSPYAILESPLLLETEQYKLVDSVIVIDVNEEIQIDRSVRRDGSDEAVIRSIIASQIDRAGRIQRADDLVSNEAGLEQLREKIEALHRKYLGMVTEK
ncbi:MAG: dephospho-CoA kinase [Proteobacteria bacterium]|nr:dephospho-CoA kinase [Pseudomonadota bacterium]MDA1291501.1 dephospho-CoA kinase [Pseudomonadota bacterium]